MSRQAGLLVIPFLLVFARPAFPQHHTGAGMALVLNSRIEHLGGTGVRAHTNIKVFMPEEGMPQGGPPFRGFFYVGFLAAPGWDVCTGVGSS